MEPIYKHILLALDLSSDNPSMIRKASALAKHCQAKLSFVHVVEISLAADHIYVDQQAYQNELKQKAQARLAQLHAGLDIHADNLHYVFGHPKEAILALADELGVDLIVVGSHGRHGFSLLLGATANAVLHGAKCDVFMLRCKSKE